MTTNVEHERWMQRCIALAEEARARGDLPVGTLIVRGGQLLAEASEEWPSTPDVTGHAELLAVRRACAGLGSADLRSATLYTTAEPCWMCAQAIRTARIDTVVFGSTTLGIGAVSSRYPILTDATIVELPPPPTVVADVLGDACRALRQRPA